MMAQLAGLSGLGAPIDYMQMVPDFRGEALKSSQANAMDVQSRARQQDMAMQQRDDQRRQQFYSAIRAATPDQLPALRKQFPEFAANIQQEIGVQDATHAAFVNKALGRIQVAYSSGDPQQIQAAIQGGAPALSSIGVQPEQAMQMFQNNPQQFGSLLNASMLSTLPVEKQFDVRNDQNKLAETVRSNQASEGLTARGQDITARGQDLSASTTRRGQDMAMSRYNQTANGAGSRPVQLSDGRTVTVSGKVHGSGANAFYEGVDNDGNVIRVPTSSISAPATSAASAQNYAMKKDIDSIEGASPDSLDFMTGVTGGNGTPALGADIRSRISGKEQRQLYNATQRIQGRMQNQGIAAARDMGASGINTVQEAKMYFQGMPQLDFSSPEAAQQSVRGIREYTDNFNQQYNVNLSGGGRQPSQQTQPQPQQSSGFSSLWGD